MRVIDLDEVLYEDHTLKHKIKFYNLICLIFKYWKRIFLKVRDKKQMLIWLLTKLKISF